MEIVAADNRGVAHSGFESTGVNAAAELPEEVLGINTTALLRLGTLAVRTGQAPWATYPTLRAAQETPRLASLAAEALKNQSLTREQVEPHVADIKTAAKPYVFGLGSVDMVGRMVPAVRRRLDERIVQTVVDKAPAGIEKADALVKSSREHVEHIARFDNPREQFSQEVAILNRDLLRTIKAQHAMRIAGTYPSLEKEPRGVFGLISRVTGGVKRFFRSLFSSPSREYADSITARDFGNGLADLAESWNKPHANLGRKTPLLGRYLEPVMASVEELHPAKLAVAAPEIVRGLFALSPDDQDAVALLRSVERSPHDARWLAKHSTALSRLRRSVDLLAAIRDVLPTNGDTIRTAYAELEALLNQNSQQKATVESEICTEVPRAIISEKRRRFRTVLKKLFGRE